MLMYFGSVFVSFVNSLVTLLTSFDHASSKHRLDQEQENYKNRSWQMRLAQAAKRIVQHFAHAAEATFCSVRIPHVLSYSSEAFKALWFTTKNNFEEFQLLNFFSTLSPWRLPLREEMNHLEPWKRHIVSRQDSPWMLQHSEQCSPCDTYVRQPVLSRLDRQSSASKVCRLGRVS